jgi:hypothetical protein
MSCSSLSIAKCLQVLHMIARVLDVINCPVIVQARNGLPSFNHVTAALRGYCQVADAL